ncbi:MAG: desulfoferrodoxin [Bacillota bacterium]|nr:desulfoferrodoxin [Bacillota bacterium]
MAKKMGIYKCEHCGNIVEVFVEGGAPIICCGEKMVYMEEKTADHSVEKHVPFVEKVEGGYLVKVGENTPHPMADAHYIMWIELVIDDLVLRKNLKPGDKPEAMFLANEGKEVYAREYCNLHGHWKS